MTESHLMHIFSSSFWCETWLKISVQHAAMARQPRAMQYETQGPAFTVFISM